LYKAQTWFSAGNPQHSVKKLLFFKTVAATQVITVSLYKRALPDNRQKQDAKEG
jgi:hypothetical protein